MTNEAQAAVIGALVGGIFGFAASSLRSLLDRRRRRCGLASILLLELRGAEHLLHRFAIDLDNTTGDFQTDHFNRLDSTVLELKGEAPGRVVEFKQRIDEIRLLRAQQVEPTQARRDRLKVRLVFAAKSVHAVKRALVESGGRLPAPAEYAEVEAANLGMPPKAFQYGPPGSLPVAPQQARLPMPHEVRIEVRSTDEPSVTVIGPTAPTPPGEIKPGAARRRIIWTWVSAVLGTLGLIGLLAATGGTAAVISWLSPRGWTIVAVAGATLIVTFVGHLIVAGGSLLAVRVTGTEERLRADYEHVAAFVGLVERPLMLGALVAGQPGFIAVWLGYKAIGKWKDWSEGGAAGRNIFVMHLLHTSLSLLVVAVVWFCWLLLRLPLLPNPAS